MTDEATNPLTWRYSMSVRPFEIVVDGTDGAGKTSCVEFLAAWLRRRYRVAIHAPYREVEVFPLWDFAPEEASHTIVTVMERFRAAHRDADVLLWDRGWPTAFVSTNDPRSRARFAPFPALTLLLLSTTARTHERARQKSNRGVWVTDPALMLRYHRAYHHLRAPLASVSVRRFFPEADGMFDLDAVALSVERALDGLDAVW
jgi:hypothetical protein